VRVPAPSQTTTRHRATAIGVALAAGAAAVLLHRESPALAPPPLCGGAAEAFGALAARVFRDAPAGLWWLHANGVLTAVAVAALVLAARTLAVSWPAAVAAALAFGLLPRFAPIVAPAAPAASALAALTLLALMRLTDPARAERAGRRSRALLWGSLALTPLFLPSAAFPVLVAIVGAGAWRSRRASSRHAIVIGGCVALATIALAAAMAAFAPRLPPSIDTSRSAWSCVLPALRHGPGLFAALTTHVFAPAGIYALALTVLGAFALGLRRDARLAVAIAYAAVVGAAVLWSDRPSDAAAPVVVVMWLVAAVGLEETLRQCRRGVGGRLAAIALVVLLPGLPFSRPAPRMPAEWTPFGQEALSQRSMERVLGAMPNGAVLVRDDAMTDVLLRSLDGTRQRTGKSLRVADRHSSALVAEAGRPRGAVYALPSASSILPLRAFALSDSLLPGLARVHWAGSCDDVGAEWHAVASLGAPGPFAFVASDAASHGPIVVYVASDAPFAGRPIDWPGATARGFSWDVFDRAPDGSEGARQDSFAEDSAPLAGVWRDAPHVARFELWRTPDAPLGLGVDPGTVPIAAMARLRPDAGASQHIAICTMTRYERARVGR
jgi:hypothetical protein